MALNPHQVASIKNPSPLNHDAVSHAVAYLAYCVYRNPNRRQSSATHGTFQPHPNPQSLLMSHPQGLLFKGQKTLPKHLISLFSRRHAQPLHVKGLPPQPCKLGVNCLQCYVIYLHVSLANSCKSFRTNKQKHPPVILKLGVIMRRTFCRVSDVRWSRKQKPKCRCRVACFVLSLLLLRSRKDLHHAPTLLGFGPTTNGV